MSNILKSAIPANSVINGYFSRIVIQRKDLSLNDVVQCFFTTAPTWVRGMMKLRDKLRTFVGLKTIERQTTSSDPNSSTFQPGEKFGLFQIIDRNANEVIMGADDKHLNFRVSIFLENNSGLQHKVSISTIVVLHNTLGRGHMKLVAPFHRIVVPGMMKKIYEGVMRQKTTAPLI